MKGNNTHKKNKLLPHSKANYSKVIILAIGTILVLMVLYFTVENQLFSASNQSAQDIATQTKELVESAKVAEKNFTVGPEPLTVPLTPQLINDKLLENSYLSIEKKTPESLIISAPQTKKCSLQEVNNYKRFLSNATQLLVKLYEGMDYDKELTEFREVVHPPEIQLILENFDNFLVKDSAENNSVIYPLNGLLSHFITVTKKNETVAMRKAREQLINNDMKTFIEYLYSDILEEKFIKCQNF